MYCIKFEYVLISINNEKEWKVIFNSMLIKLEIKQIWNCLFVFLPSILVFNLKVFEEDFTKQYCR